MRPELQVFYKQFKRHFRRFLLALLGVTEKYKPTSTQKRKAAIISYILGAIILIVFTQRFSFWGWVVWQFTGAALVVRGCFAEWYLFKHPEHSGECGHRASELRAILTVAIGVTMEFVSLGHEISEGAKLEKIASEARDRAALTESNNWVLRSNVVTLELKLQPRSIGKTQQEIFISRLKDTPKCRVNLHCINADNETMNFAFRLKDVLSAAGFPSDSVQFHTDYSTTTTGSASQLSLICVVTNLSNIPRNPIQRPEDINVFPYYMNDMEPETFKQVKKAFQEIEVGILDACIPAPESLPPDLARFSDSWRRVIENHRSRGIALVPGEITIIVFQRVYGFQ